MKKLIVSCLMVLVACNAVLAADKVGGVFGASGTTALVSAVLKPINGSIVISEANYFFTGANTTNATVKKYPFSLATTAAVLGSSSTALKINVDAACTNDGAGVVGGYTVAVNDVVVIGSAASGWQLRTISAVGTVTNGVMECTIAAGSWAAGEKVYLCKVTDIVTQTVVAVSGGIDRHSIPNFAIGRYNMPLGVSIINAGSTCTEISGTWQQY